MMMSTMYCYINIIQPACINCVKSTKTNIFELKLMPSPSSKYII